MDINAARRARQRSIEGDLTKAYSDDEACPPEWADILNDVTSTSAALLVEVGEEAERFATDPDIKTALAGRERAAKRLGMKINECNVKIKRLNLIAPHQRFTRAELDAREILRPLFRTERRPH